MNNQKNRAILDAALELAVEQGFHGMAMSQLAQKANVGVGTIYRYYESKDDVIQALYHTIKEDINRDLISGYDKSASIFERYKRIWFNLIQYYLDHPQEFLFIEQFSNSPYIYGATTVQRFHLSQTLLEFFEYASESGAIVNKPLEMVIAFMHGPVISLVKMHLAGQLKLTDELKTTAMQASWIALSGSETH